MIRQITIKTFNSPSLPIYNYLGDKEVEAFKSYEQKVNAKAAKKAEPKVEKKAEQKVEKKTEQKVDKKV